MSYEVNNCLYMYNYIYMVSSFVALQPIYVDLSCADLPTMCPVITPLSRGSTSLSMLLWSCSLIWFQLWLLLSSHNTSYVHCVCVPISNDLPFNNFLLLSSRENSFVVRLGFIKSCKSVFVYGIDCRGREIEFVLMVRGASKGRCKINLVVIALCCDMLCAIIVSLLCKFSTICYSFSLLSTCPTFYHSMLTFNSRMHDHAISSAIICFMTSQKALWRQYFVG